MKELLKKLLDLKSELKGMSKKLKSELLEDSQYSEFYEEAKAANEVLRSYRGKLVADSTSLSTLQKKILDKKAEIGVVKKAIKDNVMVVEKESGEQLQFSFNF